MLLNCGAGKDYSKEIKPVNPKENQPWMSIGRTDAEVKTPILWPPDAKSQLIGKDPDVGKDWRQREKKVAEDEMVGWHHWFSGHNLGELWETVRDREVWHVTMGSQRVGYALATEQQQTIDGHYFSTLNVVNFCASNDIIVHWCDCIKMVRKFTTINQWENNNLIFDSYSFRKEKISYKNGFVRFI